MDKEKVHIFFDFGLSEVDFSKLKKVTENYGKSLIVSERETITGMIQNVDDVLKAQDFSLELIKVVNDFNEQFAFIETMPDLRTNYLRSAKTLLFEHNISAVIKWLYTLKILEKEYGHKNLCFVLPRRIGSNQIALLEAEGEISTFKTAKLLYRKTDFLPNFLRQFCKFHGFEIKFSNYYSISYKFQIGRLYRKFLRIYVHIFVRIQLVLFRYIFRKNKNKTRKNIGATILAFSKANAHSEYLAKLVNRDATFCLIQESLISNGQVDAASQIMFKENKYANIYDYVSTLDLIFCVGACIKDLCKTILYNMFESRSIEIYDIKISLNLVAIEAVIMKFEFLILEKAIKRFRTFNPDVKTLVHCDLNSLISTFLEQSSVCKSLNLFQLAFGSYVVKALPDFVRGTEFLCFSDNQRKVLSQMALNPIKVQYRGNMYVDSNSYNVSDIQNRLSKTSPVLAYCTQPYDKEGEKKLILILQSMSLELGFNLVIIYHPRDSVLEFPGDPQSHVRLLDNIEYVTNKEQFDREFSFIIMRHSNIGLRFIFKGIPVINVHLAEVDKLIVQDYFEGYPLLFDNVDALRKALSNTKKTTDQFFKFRSNFLNQVYPEGDICNFIESYEAIKI